MKDKVTHNQASSIENLWLVMKEAWVTEMTQEYYESLVSSKPGRIQAAIDGRGRLSIEGSGMFTVNPKPGFQVYGLGAGGKKMERSF